MAGPPQTSLGAYSIVFVAAIVSLCIPAFLWLVSRLVGPTLTRVQRPVSSQHSELGLKFNSRFFLASLIAMSLFAILLMVLPLAVNLQAGIDSGVIKRSLLGILTLLAVAGLCLLYSQKKRDLDWLKNYGNEGE